MPDEISSMSARIYARLDMVLEAAITDELRHTNHELKSLNHVTQEAIEAVERLLVELRSAVPVSDPVTTEP